MDANELSLRFVSVIPRTMRIYRKEIRNAAKSEFTIPQVRVMSYLNQHDFASNLELSEHVGIPAAMMSRLIDTLVRQGWVKRKISPEDRRQIRISLTPQGKRRFSTIQKATRETFSRIFSQFNETEQRTIDRGLSLLGEAFGP